MEKDRMKGNPYSPILKKSPLQETFFISLKKHPQALIKG
jgi:hypothetical protein